MASFIARVELHSATYADYEKLHTAMGSQGYARYIVSDEGESYWLPTGTYVAESVTWDRSAALSRAKTAASRTYKNYAAVIAEWTGTSWVGLEKKG
jgi:hypothetical protein